MSDAPLSARRLGLCLPVRQISGWYEELGARFPHPKPYARLVLLQLGQGGKSYPPAMQGDHIKSPQTTRDTRKMTEFFLVRLTVK